MRLAPPCASGRHRPNKHYSEAGAGQIFSCPFGTCHSCWRNPGSIITAFIRRRSRGAALPAPRFPAGIRCQTMAIPLRMEWFRGRISQPDDCRIDVFLVDLMSAQEDADDPKKKSRNERAAVLSELSAYCFGCLSL